MPRSARLPQDRESLLQPVLDLLPDAFEHELACQRHGSWWHGLAPEPQTPGLAQTCSSHGSVTEARSPPVSCGPAFLQAWGELNWTEAFPGSPELETEQYSVVQGEGFWAEVAGNCNMHSLPAAGA